MKTTPFQININGTDAETLAEWHYRVITEIRRMIELVKDVEPHGRDFQHFPADYKAARDQHIWRLAQLEHMLAEYTALYENIHEQIEKRKALQGR